VLALRDKEGRIGVGGMERPNSKAHVEYDGGIGYFLCTVILSGTHMDLSQFGMKVKTEDSVYRGLNSEIVISFMMVFNHYRILTIDFFNFFQYCIYVINK
jgi:hypothetical protein